MNDSAEPPAPPQPPPVVAFGELLASLEEATFMAKQLQPTTNPNDLLLLQILSCLRQAEHRVSSLLPHIQVPPSPPPENSMSSATESEAMQIAEEEEEGCEGNSKVKMVERVEEVEEKMRGCFIKNKRPKRQLSPSSEQMLSDEAVKVFDPHTTKSRALTLIYQFHF
ncbi:hypothetical protein K2173_024979 [Erythroxylum novogranatense]|uniref:Uncharacterized protein n=1 Tax=Erythroxylum novogranatense TaxID=1862640 RepID=A0AAV8UE63_9ROSI|nr:hypothetical protein K2173_024979 [Erythroxylum novogranatense]